MQTNKYLLVSAVVSAAFMFALPAMADTVGPVTFESPTYTVGNINGQDGWLKTGSYDANVTATGIPAGFGAQSLQISDAVTSGSFGDQTFAKPLTDSVGETASTNGTFSPGTKQAHFEMQFDIASVLQTLQTGMHLSVSPDRGDGSRMSYLRFEDQADGIHVFFDDVTDPGPVGTVATFNDVDVGTISRTSHTIKLTMDMVDGAGNDIVKVYIDGSLVHTGTSWEDYYRFDPEAAAEQSPRIIKTVEFRESGTATPADAGNGFLVDNFSQSSGPIPTPPPSTVKVTIDKLIDGVQATAASANSSAFPMSATWNATNIGAGSGTFNLSTAGFNSPNPYEAITSDMTVGASYTTNEVTGGAVVGADCTTGQPYTLVGYSTGATLAAAMAAVATTTAPNFTNLQSDAFVIVHNQACLPAPVNVSPVDGTTLTTATWLTADWTDVTDPFPPIAYFYESSNSPTLNPDGSFVTPVYQSGALSISEIPTPGTPAGTWYWHARAKDADGNLSPWSAATKVIVDNTPVVMPQVHIFKYVDGVLAVDTNINSAVFPMETTFDSPNLGVATNAPFTLSPVGWGPTDSAYEASFVGSNAGANYEADEVLSSAVVGASCDGSHTFSLVGYSTGDTLAAAQAATPSLTNPSFTNLQSDKYVIVFNKTCPTTGSLTIEKEAIGGNSTFSFTGSNGIGSFTITTTGNTGSVTFPNLTPGSYTVTETAKAGWTQTSSDCSAVAVSAGGDATCTIVNTNNKLLGAILGTKYEDRDGDGTLKDGNHHKLAGVTIYIDKNTNGILDAGDVSTVTDSHGAYHFLGLAAGTYIVREVVQAGWTQTVPSSGSYTVVLTAGQVAKNKNFGNFKPGVISGVKFNDLNANHRKDAGEPGLSGWTVTIKGPHGFTASAVTDSNGNYSFGNLAAGTYTLAETMKPGWRQTLHPNTVLVRSSMNALNKNFGNTQKPKARGDRSDDDQYRD